MRYILLSITATFLSSQVFASECQTNIQATTPDSDFVVVTGGHLRHLGSGLVWQRCPVGFDLQTNGTSADLTDDSCVENGSGASDNLYTWQNALSNLQVAGWRVPNIKELMSIIEFRCREPAWNTARFPALPGSFDTANGINIWTSTPTFSINTAQSSAQIWQVDFRSGGTVFGSINSSQGLVRLVRDTP